MVHAQIKTKWNLCGLALLVFYHRGEHVKMLLEHSHPLFHKKYYFNTSKPTLLFYQIILQYFIHKML